MIDEEMAPLRPADQALSGEALSGQVFTGLLFTGPDPSRRSAPRRQKFAERVVDPGSGGVDDGPRDKHDLAVLRSVLCGDRRDPEPAVSLQVGRPSGEDVEKNLLLRSDRPGIDEELDSEPLREHHLRVVVDPGERVAGHIDGGHPGLPAADEATARPYRAGREEIVEPQPTGNGEAAAAAFPRPATSTRLEAENPRCRGGKPAKPALHRHDESKGANEVGRESQESVALGETLAHQRQLPILQIAQATMNQPRRPAGRPGGDVVGIDHDDGEAVENEFPGQRRPVDAGPEDHDIDRNRRRFHSDGRANGHRSNSRLVSPDWSTATDVNPRPTPEAADDRHYTAICRDAIDRERPRSPHGASKGPPSCHRSGPPCSSAAVAASALRGGDRPSSAWCS